MKRHIIYLLLTLGIALPAMANQENDEEANLAILDSLEEIMYASIGTPECVTAAEAYINTCDKYGYDYMSAQGTTFKLTALLSTAEYRWLELYADSIIAEYDMKQEYPEFYYQTIFYKTLSYIQQGKYKLAITLAQELYEDSHESDDDNNGTPQYINNRCNALECLGLANREMGQYNEAIKYFDECIELTSEYPDLKYMCLDAETYKMQTAQKFEDKDVALKYIVDYQKFFEDFRNSNETDPDFESVSLVQQELLMHVGYIHVYCEMKEFAKAKQHLDIAKQLTQDNELIGEMYAEVDYVSAKYYKCIGDNALAIHYADNAISYYHTSSMPSIEVEVLRIKLEAMHNERMYADEYEVSNRIVNLNDSLYKLKYESSVEELETTMNVNKLKSETQTLAAQRQMWVFVSISVVLAAFFIIVLLNRHRDKEKQKILSQQKELLEQEVERQTSELRQQKTEIEQKNRDITDSINYAQRIQSSILPDLGVYKNFGIEGAFAFFIPCNIVSGDFYWATRHGNNLVIACSDCTGHGVPGAFVSMIGSTSLNEISSSTALLEPGEILEELDKNVFKVLGQSGNEARDGMDIAIISYNPDTHIVKWAGARRPIYVIHPDGELVEYKGVKRSIGETDQSSREKPFVTQELEVVKGDTIYMCSDGLGDQFGGQEINGPDGKRLMSGGLKRMLAKICQEDIDKQRETAEKLYWEWRGTCPQLDDISLVGIRF